jgi:hypothetical protein
MKIQGIGNPPQYREIIERYNIDYLKTTGDLVAKNGNIAITKRGDLMLNSDEYSALATLVGYWRFNEPYLRTLFALALTTKGRLESLIKTRDDSLDRFVNHERNDEISANAIGTSSYAGAIVMVLSRLLLAFKDDLNATDQEWTQSGPKIEGCSIGAIIEAAANNFRHNDEWLKHAPKPTPQQLRSIRVLATALREPIAQDGSHHGLSRDICPEVLALLSDGDFERLASNHFAFANAIPSARA